MYNYSYSDKSEELFEVAASACLLILCCCKLMRVIYRYSLGLDSNIF